MEIPFGTRGYRLAMCQRPAYFAKAQFLTKEGAR